MAAVTMKANEQVNVVVQGQFADGRPAALPGPVTWSSTDGGTRVTIVPDPTDPTGQKATIKGKGVAGTTTVTAQVSGVQTTIDFNIESMYASQLVVLSISPPFPV